MPIHQLQWSNITAYDGLIGSLLYRRKTCCSALWPGLWHRRQWWCRVHRGNSWTLLYETSPDRLCPTASTNHPTALPLPLPVLGIFQGFTIIIIMNVIIIINISNSDNNGHDNVHSTVTKTLPLQVYPILLLNATQHQVAANLWNKLIHLSHRSTHRH